MLKICSNTTYYMSLKYFKLGFCNLIDIYLHLISNLTTKII